MMKRLTGGWRTLALLLILASCGCGGKDAPVKVEGTVTLDGKPLEGAVVAFVPVSEGLRQAVGTTGSDGSFRLTTFNFGDGALPGEYKITITKQQESAGLDVSEDSMRQGSKGAVEMMKKMSMKKAKPPKPKSVLPATYNDVAKTPLKQVVPTDGPVKLDLRSSGS